VYIHVWDVSCLKVDYFKPYVVSPPNDYIGIAVN